MKQRRGSGVKVLKLLGLLCVLCAVSPAQEQFAGPFASWKNVVTGCGATGNGSTDDTTALQNCLNGFGGVYDVIYFPAGTYKITSTLNLNHRLYSNLIGADPATTKVLWAGSSGGTMIHMDGVNGCHFGRITWDGNHSAAVDVFMGWTNLSIAPASVDNVHFDEYFINAGKGLVGGVSPPGNNDSEVRFFRCHFIGNTTTGLSIETQNALDYWVWDSEFTNNARGVSNNTGPGNGGNFYVYNSLFQNSSVADVTTCTSNFPFSLKNNVSSGSNQFYNSCNPGQNSTQLFIQGNRILDTTNPIAIQIGDVGTTVLVDNKIRSSVGAVGPAVRMQSFGGSDFTSVGNQFTVSSAISVSGSPVRQWATDDSVVSYASISGTIPTLPSTPTRLTANIIEVAAGSSGSAIQTAINTANGLAGAHPVVHIPKGSYSIGSTISVPANLDVLIVGDSQNTVLNWTASGAGSIFDLQGPSKAQIADIALYGNHLAELVTVENSDQNGAVVTALAGATQGANVNDVLSDALLNTKINLMGMLLGRSSTLSVKALGAGPSTTSRIGIFGTASGTINTPPAGAMYALQNNGRILVEDSWYESGVGPTVANLSGSGMFTYQGGHIAQVNNGSGTTPGVPIGVNGFTGSAAFIGLSFDIPSSSSTSEITVTNENSGTNALFLGLVDNQPLSNYFNRTGSGGTVTFINNKIFGGSGAVQITDQGNARTDAFIRSMMNQIRTETADLPTATSAGLTNVLLSRIGYNTATIGLHVKSSGVTLPNPPTGLTATVVQ